MEGYHILLFVLRHIKAQKKMWGDIYLKTKVDFFKDQNTSVAKQNKTKKKANELKWNSDYEGFNYSFGETLDKAQPLTFI